MLLRQLKIQNPDKRLSCTIRLHQYRHPDKTGVPPAERGMLMVYNTGDVRDPATRNSIFSYDAIRPYFDGAAPYPLPLDVALPAFRWGVLFHLGKFEAILSPALFEEFRTKFRETAPGRYTALEDFTMDDRYIREGDVVRWEEADPGEVRRVIALLKKALPAAPRTVSFFHATASDDHAAQTRYFQDLLAAFR